MEGAPERRRDERGGPEGHAVAEPAEDEAAKEEPPRDRAGDDDKQAGHDARNRAGDAVELAPDPALLGLQQRRDRGGKQQVDAPARECDLHGAAADRSEAEPLEPGPWRAARD